MLMSADEPSRNLCGTSQAQHLSLMAGSATCLCFVCLPATVIVATVVNSLLRHVQVAAGPYTRGLE
jgi:hypothetical protein